MKTGKRVILYIDGEMTPEEKISFETELKNSPVLQKELNLYKNFFASIEETKNVSHSNSYFDNIVPEFRQRLENNKQRKFYPGAAYVFPAISVIFLLFFFLLGYQNQKPFVTLQNTTANIDTSIIIKDIDLMDFSIDELISSNLISNNNEKYSSELNNLIEKELNISSDNTKFLVADKVLDYNSIIDNISETDAELVYNNILNKKF
jgi:hypothetical protein